MASVVLEHLTHVVDGETHLAGVDLVLQSGELQVVLGPTGAGKTTLLRLVAGLERPTAGTVRFAGFEGADTPRERRARVAMVYQEFVNYPSLSVFENIASPLVAARRGRAEIERRVRAMAARLRIEELLERLPEECSGGQQQRTAIARALVKDAALLLLDEPLANLDLELREELRGELAELLRERGAAVLYTTTDPAEALWFGGRTAVLHAGRLLQEGPARAVYDAPASEAVARATSDPPLNLWDVEVLAGGRMALSDELAFPLPAHLAGLAPGRWRLGLRAHQLRRAPRSPRDVRVPARLELAEVNGCETFLHARHAALALLAHAGGAHAHALGERLELFLDAEAAFAFHPDGRLAGAPPPRG